MLRQTPRAAGVRARGGTTLFMAAELYGDAVLLHRLLAAGADERSECYQRDRADPSVRNIEACGCCSTQAPRPMGRPTTSSGAPSSRATSRRHAGGAVTAGMLTSDLPCISGRNRPTAERSRVRRTASGSVLSTEAVLHNIRDRCRSVPTHSAVEQPPRQQSKQNEQNRDGEQPDAQRSVIAGAQSLQPLLSAAIPSSRADWAESSRQNPPPRVQHPRKGNIDFCACRH